MSSKSIFSYFKYKTQSVKSISILLIGVLLFGLALSASGCIEVSPSQVSVNTPKVVINPPDAVVTSTNCRTSVEGLHYYTYVDVSVHNNGGSGTVVVWTTVTQGSNQWTKSQSVYLNERESRDLVFTFIEPSFWDSNTIRSRTWVEN